MRFSGSGVDWRLTGVFTPGFMWDSGNFNPVLRRRGGCLDAPWVAQGEQGWRDGGRMGVK